MSASPSTFKGGLDRDSVWGRRSARAWSTCRQAGEGTSGPAATTLNGVEEGPILASSFTQCQVVLRDCARPRWDLLGALQIPR